MERKGGGMVLSEYFDGDCDDKEGNSSGRRRRHGGENKDMNFVYTKSILLFNSRKKASKTGFIFYNSLERGI